MFVYDEVLGDERKPREYPICVILAHIGYGTHSDRIGTEQNYSLIEVKGSTLLHNQESIIKTSIEFTVILIGVIKLVINNYECV
jgi:hypothetical protein